MLAGGIAAFSLPIEQYPTIAPPSVVINATYPGADSESLSRDTLSSAFQQIARTFDAEWGGFGDAPKFPPSMTLGPQRGREDPALRVPGPGAPKGQVANAAVTRIAALDRPPRR